MGLRGGGARGHRRRSRVLTGGFSEEELREAGATAVFGSVQELLERLEETPLA